jgi:hypothetical protein
MFEQRGIAGREVFLFLQIPECRRQTVRAVFAWAAASLPKRVLQSCSKCLEALTAIDHAGVLPARERQHEVIQQVFKRDAADRHAQLVHVSEVRQASRAGQIRLGEEHFLVRPFKRAPLTDVPLEGATHAVRETLRMVFLQFAQQGDRLQLWRTAQQRDDLRFPDVGKRIRTGTPITPRLLRWQAGIVFDASRRALAHA